MLFKKLYILYNRLELFFKEEYNERSFLVFFRVMISLIAIVEFLSLLSDLPLFFSSSEVLIPQELMYLQQGSFKYLYPFYQFIEKHNLIEFFYQWAPYIYLIALFFLLLGLFTRYAVIVALILQLIIYKSFSVFNYGYDYFLTMSLFYCFMFPVGKYYSIDLKLFKCNNLFQFNYQRILQIHLSIAYFFSGIAKGLDVGWWNGNSMWSSIASVDNSFHSIPSFFLITGGIATVFMEFSYPFLVLKNTTRKYAVTIMIIMHTAIAIMMDLYAFSAIMIVWNIAAFGKITAKNKTIYVAEAT